MHFGREEGGVFVILLALSHWEGGEARKGSNREKRKKKGH